VGDEARVRELLTPDAVLVSDGGAARHAARRAVIGPERIGRFLVNIGRRWMGVEGHEMGMRMGWVNGAPGILLTLDGTPWWVATMAVKEGRVDRFFVMVNPDKLGAIDRHVDIV